MKHFVLTVMAFLLLSNSWAQTPSQVDGKMDFSRQIDDIYTFKPSKLTSKEQETKVPALDKFWDEVKTDSARYLPKLRFELGKTGHQPYFYYDGSELLLSLSSSKADMALASDAISRCDLDDIDQKLYVTRINNLARGGVNTTLPAIKILQDEKFSFFLPQHVMTFNQGYCLSYMLLPQSDKSYVDTLIALFPSVGKTGKLSIVMVLWHAYSCKGDAFLQSTMTNKDVEKEVREYAKAIMRPAKLTRDQEKYLKTDGQGDIDKVRTEALERFSDEAVDELELATLAARKKNSCQ
jgi:hypothetical protein